VRRVTLDTSAVGPPGRARVEAACRGRNVELVNTTVTDRELEGTNIPPMSGAPLIEIGIWGESRCGEFVWDPEPRSVPETLVIGESRLGQAALGSDESPLLFEIILRVISNGSFPPPGERDNLSRGHRKQLRDAMGLEAHTREGRDVMVTNDKRAFTSGTDAERFSSASAPRGSAPWTSSSTRDTRVA